MNNTRSIAARFAFAFFMAAALIVACQTNPVATAQTPAQKAYATYGVFAIAETQAAELVANPVLPPAVGKALRDADAKAKPAIDSLLAALREYNTVKKAVDAGTTTADKLNIVNANLVTWIAQAQPLVDDLVNAVKGAKQ